MIGPVDGFPPPGLVGLDGGVGPPLAPPLVELAAPELVDAVSALLELLLSLELAQVDAIDA